MYRPCNRMQMERDYAVWSVEVYDRYVITNDRPYTVVTVELFGGGSHDISVRSIMVPIRMRTIRLWEMYILVYIYTGIFD